MATDVEVLSGDPIVNEARKRWNRVNEWESTFRARFIEDLKFRHGDSDNGYQWPGGIRATRDVDRRPCLTMNIIRQHNLMISNQAKQNKSTVKFIATGGGTSSLSAGCLRDVMRHIEYRSNAQAAYSLARDFQIDAGRGWWRLYTKYVSNETFDQEIGILPVLDPLSVYFDPDTVQKDRLDGRWGLVFDDVPKGEFEEAYPKYAGMAGAEPLGLGSTDNGWIMEGDVRVCEYFRKVEKADRLLAYVSMGQRRYIRESKCPEDVWEKLKADRQSQIREIADEVVEWKLIVGNTVVDETIWPGQYIPLIPVIGEECVIDGVYDSKGHTRAMKDAQRMFNYNASSQVEHVALQGKTPWTAPIKAIEELEQIWNTANTTNHSVLPYNHVDDEGNPVPPPQRTDPPNASPAYQAGMDTAFSQMMMTSGQWQNQMGMMGNERTGAAIGKRQQQSETAVFHFEDNYEIALRASGKQVLDIFPKVYDTKRVLMLLTENDDSYELEVDPTAQQAYQEHLSEAGEVIKRIFNPNIGSHDVAAAVGPAYGSRREETVEALTLIMTQNPALTGIIGDLLMSSMDFDKANEAAQRLRRMVPPMALGKGPSPAEQKLMGQVEALSKALADALEQSGKQQLRLAGKEQQRDIEVYKAETDRMEVLGKQLPLDPELLSQLISEAMQTSLLPILGPEGGETAAPVGTAGGPLPSAQQAPDGEWYLSDPTRRGKYLKVAPLAEERKPRGQ